ncbi:hypothetical protein [Sporosarcina sp. FSL W7-1283]|uniref:hypothetical protein n=1 Tax=Sporosarcina sp. FSL W7-1283 TaxID=2921560 RepID=UPI0030F8857B
MKTIKSEGYKGYQITVGVEFKEDTTTYIHHENLDSVKYKVTVQKGLLPSKMLFGSVEKEKSKREEMYDALDKGIEKMVKQAKEQINKEVREREITEGLPESLLNMSEDVEIEIHNSGKIKLPEGIKIENVNGSRLELTKNGVKIAGDKIILNFPEL